MCSGSGYFISTLKYVSDIGDLCALIADYDIRAESY